MPKFDNLMIDFETLATTADAMVVSVGAVKFNIDTGEIDPNGYYTALELDEQFLHRRRVMSGTLTWWMSPDQRPAQDVFLDKNTKPISEFLPEFADFIGGAIEQKNMKMWSNGASFDLPILQHLYVDNGIEPPWKFWNDSCYRTIKNLPMMKGLVLPKFDGTKHNALADAMWQAQCLCIMWKHMMAHTPPKPGKK